MCSKSALRDNVTGRVIWARGPTGEPGRLRIFLWPQSSSTGSQTRITISEAHCDRATGNGVLY